MNAMDEVRKPLLEARVWDVRRDEGARTAVRSPFRHDGPTTYGFGSRLTVLPASLNFVLT